jgi:hypothetical protein
VTSFLIEPGEGRHEDYVALLRAVWGGEAMSRELFDWWLAANPAGSIVSVATIGGVVVGGSAHSLVRLSLAGEERLGQFSVHSVTAEQARGKGIFRALELRNEELGAAQGSACALVFANSMSEPIYLGPLGWTRIDRRRVWARPLPGAVRRLARLAARRPSDPEYGAAGIRPIVEYRERHEAAYRRVAGTWGNHVRRDAGHLRWRYGESPRAYRGFESPNGLAVLGETTRQGLRVALLMDLFAPPREAAHLLRHCLRASQRHAALLAVPTPSVPRSMLARLGFVPTHVDLDFMGKALTGVLDTRSASWTFTLGDTDFF